MASEVDTLRREILLEIQSYDKQTQQMLNTYIRQIEMASKKHPNNFDAFQKAVLVVIGAMFLDFSTISSAHNGAAAGKFATFVDKTLIRDLTKARAINTAAELKKSTATYEQRVARSFILRRNPVDNRSFSDRIVTLQRGSNKIVDGLIRIGIKQGNSVNEVAKAIEGYIDPQSQFGRRITSGSRINYRMVPLERTKIPKGSINYNAVRIARSEIMQTYDNASAEYYEDKPWSQGWDWFLSNTHTGNDECNVLARQSPHKKLPQRPHPQCTCRTQPRVIALKGFEALVRDGVIS